MKIWEKYFCNWDKQRFLIRAQKEQTITNINFTKIKNTFFSKHTVNKLERQPQLGAISFKIYFLQKTQL